jgi:hypothetical protein
MRPPQLEASIRQQTFTMTILWGALLASLVAYLVVAYVVVAAATGETTQGSSALAGEISAMALGAALASIIVPHQMLSDARLREVMKDGGEQRLLALPGRYFAPWIVGMALAEAVAVFGLVLTLLTHDVRAMLPFVGAAALLMVLKRPNLRAFVARAERLAR